MTEAPRTSADDDPIHEPVGETSAWTRTNTAEAFPGVMTPLGWTYTCAPLEGGFREGMVRMGILRPHEAAPPALPEQRFIGAVQFGRLATSVDAWRGIADRMPGNSGDALERQFFGSVRPGIASEPARGRTLDALVHVLPRLLAATKGSAAAIQAGVATGRTWWQARTRELEDATPARAHQCLLEARATYRHWSSHAGIVAMVAQGLYERVRRACETGGAPGLEIELLANREASHEAHTVEALWDVSRNRLSMQDFLSHYGYHGPDEGQLHARSWREVRAPVETLVATYRDMPDADSPTVQRATLMARRREAEARAEKLPARERLALRLLLPLARTLMLRREASRILAHVQCNDVARAAVRVLARDRVRRGLLDEPEDAFHLTFDELAGDGAIDDSARAAARHVRWTAYQGLELPMRWIGRAQPIAAAAPRDGGSILSGIGAGPGVVEGRACVVLDPGEADDFQPNDVLVCRTTDPGWAALFVVASAVVIDIGGTMSHGAIVARELGIPCVIGTGDGTRRISQGARLRVDGSAGTVTIL